MQTVNVLGVAVSATNPDHAAAEINSWIMNGMRRYVCVSGVHGVMECHRDVALRRIHNSAGLVLPDGMPLAWWVRHSYPEADRVCGPEFMPALLDLSQSKGYRHFFYGASEATLRDMTRAVAERYPQARVVGTYSPPYRPLTPAEDEVVVEMLNASGADIVWVGLSTPKQEKWMAAHRDVLTAPALIGVGAAFDLLAGHTQRAPMVWRRSGFEWAYRLMTEPRRLWRRYLVNNPAFVALAAMQIAGLAKFPIERLFTNETDIGGDVASAPR